MRLIALSLTLLVAALPAAGSAQEWSFDSGAEGWPEGGEGNRWVAEASDGVYAVRVCKPMTRVLQGPDVSVEGDFRLEARVRYANACWYDSYGIAFSPTADLSTHYLVEWIQGDLGCQRYQVVKRAGGQSTRLFSDWIFPLYQFNGGNEWNDWRIERQGTQLRFFVNDHFLFEVTDEERWDRVWLGTWVSTFENSCDGPINDAACVRGTEVHFDHIRVEPLEGETCRRDFDCAADALCDPSAQSCIPGAAPADGTVRFFPADARVGEDVVFVVPDDGVVVEVQDPAGTWITPTPLGERDGGRAWGIADLSAGTYRFGLFRGAVPEHASDCGDGRSSEPFVELEQVGSARLDVR